MVGVRVNLVLPLVPRLSFHRFARDRSGPAASLTIDSQSPCTAGTCRAYPKAVWDRTLYVRISTTDAFTSLNASSRVFAFAWLSTTNVMPKSTARYSSRSASQSILMLSILRSCGRTGSTR